MEKTKKRSAIALILMSFLMASLQTEGNEVDKVSDTMARPVVHTDSTESSSKAREGQAKPTPVPMVPSEENGPSAASDELSEGVEQGDGSTVESEGEVVEPSALDKLKNYISNTFNSAKERGARYYRELQYEKLYGPDASKEPNFSLLYQMEQDLEDGYERERQREFDMLVLQQEADRLYTESERCLALNIFHEARNQTADQGMAVAAVTLNRLSVGFRGATTICEVVYTPKQFSWVEQHSRHGPDMSNSIEKGAWNRAVLTAKRFLNPDATYIDPSNGALYYYNPSLVDWAYKDHYVEVAVLGDHRFMTEPDKNHPHFIDNSVIRINPVLFNGMSHEDREQLKAEHQSKGI